MTEEGSRSGTALIFFVYGAFMAWLLTAAGSWKSAVGIAAVGVAVALLNTVVLAHIGASANQLVVNAHERDRRRAANKVRLVLSTLGPEWESARLQVRVLRTLLGQSMSADAFAFSQDVRGMAAAQIQRIGLAQTDEARDDLLDLPPNIVATIGVANGTLRKMARICEQAASLMTPGACRDEFGDLVEYADSDHARDEFSPAYRTLSEGAVVLDSALTLLIDAAHRGVTSASGG